MNSAGRRSVGCPRPLVPGARVPAGPSKADLCCKVYIPLSEWDKTSGIVTGFTCFALRVAHGCGKIANGARSVNPTRLLDGGG